MCQPRLLDLLGVPSLGRTRRNNFDLLNWHKILMIRIGVMSIYAAILLNGCSSPEDGRERGGGAGGDGGNYRKKPTHAPSKIDGTKSVPANKP